MGRTKHKEINGDAESIGSINRVGVIDLTKVATES
jgi:hypothetical protein